MISVLVAKIEEFFFSEKNNNKQTDGMADSVDHYEDQSDLDLHCLVNCIRPHIMKFYSAYIQVDR